MTTTLSLILSVLGIFALYALVAPIALNVGRYVGRNWLFCPEHQEYARVGVRPLGAALGVAYGARSLSVRRCTLLGRGQTCDAQCLSGVQY
jgi:hypothetical protein